MHQGAKEVRTAWCEKYKNNKSNLPELGFYS